MLNMAIITSHIFTVIFLREHVFAQKYLVGNKKKMGFHLIPKSDKDGEISTGSFKRWMHIKHTTLIVLSILIHTYSFNNVSIT